MAASSRDRPPMLAREDMLSEYPYKLTTVTIPAVPAVDDSLAVPKCIAVETLLNIYKGKKIAKPITPPSESAFEEDNNPEQAQRDKNMQKNLPLIAKYFKKINKPTNNLKTSSNSRNKNVDTCLRYKNDNQTGQFGNQMTVTVTGARETVDSGTDSKPLEKVVVNVLSREGTRFNPMCKTFYQGLRMVFVVTIEASSMPWKEVGSELGSELTLLAGSELKTSELDTSELKTSEYRFLKIFILVSYEQELCQFKFLLASCQLSSSELRIASYRLIEDNFSSDL
ncbi:hypothetical protein Tco_0964003 [Tanacetum coccineum]